MRTLAASPRPAPATFAATRAASPIGSGPRPAASGREPRAGAVRAAAGRADERGAFFADVARALGAALFAGPPDDAPPPARFSLRRPGRERGRLPITPGSSVTAAEYYRGVAILCAPRLEIRCFARESGNKGVYSWTRYGKRDASPLRPCLEDLGHVDRGN